ncbi:MAG: hypothetical protein OXI87_05115 [Albidovulum sp.]|nr:hypothetical protein [Albidovulum sp.]
MPELTPASIKELAKREPQPLSVERRIDRALKTIGRPPRFLDGPLLPIKGTRRITVEQCEFMAQQNAVRVWPK